MHNFYLYAHKFLLFIQNPPPKAKDPDEWKAFFETKFEGVKVTVCTVSSG